MLAYFRHSLVAFLSEQILKYINLCTLFNAKSIFYEKIFLFHAIQIKAFQFSISIAFV